MSNILRTPDDRFADLPDFPFDPHYLTIEDPQLGALRMHYLDEGIADHGTVLMLHGEPSWSYLYRKLVGPVAAAGWRVIAPDHIGFGRSDKPADRGVFSYDRYVGWMRQFIDRLGLDRMVLVAQDWGGPIGLRVLADAPERYLGVFATNTLLPNAEPPPRGVDDWPGPIVRPWIEHCRSSDDLAVSEVIAATFVQRPGEDVLAAYDAPFPDASYKAAALALTTLIPAEADSPGIAENRAAWKVLESFEQPFATAFSDNDPSTAAWEGVFRARIPGAARAPHSRIDNAGHFVQEEQGDALAKDLVKFLATLGKA
ncbi:haloalkane dehalogenase [Croceicoccus sp. F390]|uniref:Haloalkane dehalogenase n=1 Tax=Croceicoccus esteveae TaxID=3075597 RepID=A0ABU2ZH00_9SPHN|nr:haloalkane dehalogenase [Croceicoccus sp. F390]MDT0575875.1 haloalkane dehalogenase [Croceicoccus sp. F390]